MYCDNKKESNSRYYSRLSHLFVGIVAFLAVAFVIVSSLLAYMGVGLFSNRSEQQQFADTTHNPAVAILSDPQRYRVREASLSNAVTIRTDINRPTDYSKWSDLSQEIHASLQAGFKEYNNNNRVTASQHFREAYNVYYIASNFGKVAEQYLGEADFQQAQQAFQNLIESSYGTDNPSAVQNNLQQVEQLVNAQAQSLDARSDVKNPRDYGQARDKTIKEQRKVLDSQLKKTEGRGSRTWLEVAHEMNTLLDKAQRVAISGHGQEGCNIVLDVYYKYYERLGFEKGVGTAISGQRVSLVEYQFKQAEKQMYGNASAHEIKGTISELKKMIIEDATFLDKNSGATTNSVTGFLTSPFGQAFLILLREGLEAILVIAAIIAYLVKSGNRDKLRYIYLGVVLALIASGLVAMLFTWVYESSGMHQEILEGVTALVAMVLLFFTSNWMLSKTSVSAWNDYIRSKTAASLSRGSVLSLASLSFLAVFREGAETVMFYQALFGMSSGGGRDIWLGFACACVVLVIIFCLIRFTSVYIPIRPFFAITSVFLAIMVVLFAGGGLHELIEANVINGTYMPGWPTFDWLGIYPYVETVVFQIVMLVLVVGFGIMSMVRHRKLDAQQNQSKNVHDS